MNSAELDERLNALWQRRAALSQTEWEELYALIERILSRYHPPALGDLPDNKADYIIEFFSIKVFEAATRTATGDASARIHAGAIRVFFNNFLLDRRDVHLRSPLRNAESLHPDENDDGEPHRPPDLCGCTDIALDVLEENGLDAEKVRTAAARWLDAQEPWVVLYLGLHHCPDADASLPLIHLSERYAVASYHHKARKLGLTHQKKDRNQPWFHDTLLGRWLECDLNLAIEADSGPALEAALALLCEAAIARVAGDVSKSPGIAR
jgi:hypothetical protein